LDSTFSDENRIMISSSAEPKKVAYVVDDEAGATNVVCKFLAAIGFIAEGFTGPAPFLVRVKMRPPDMVIVDLALGQSDAVEVMRQLEIIRFGGGVLLISGRDQITLDEIRRVGLQRGLAMLPCLRKPFRLDDLRKAVATHPEIPPGAGSAGATTTALASTRVNLAEALREGWLELWYQAKIDLKTMRTSGAEALVRARHPEFGIVSPAMLLPPPGDPAYHPLSHFVFRQALGDWPIFADAGLPLKLAVNMPISVLQAPEFVRMARQHLPVDGRFPGLIVEVTEDEVAGDLHQLQEISAQLKLYGITLSIDDFGTAYSSLARLMEMPCAELKIDRSFVSGCATTELRRAVCQTIVNLAHRFGISVCAEGVEQLDDLRCLISMGCDTVQGFYFGQPMGRDAFIRHLTTSTEPAATLQRTVDARESAPPAGQLRRQP
jgi:EAL domain-containing protein (putative c-di-GMP-specific phosphodiesterase class I)/FixJ family two-component response regulator